MRYQRQQMHMRPLQWMVDEAIEFIREHEPPEGYFVAFSGGKDSIVTLELTRMAGVKHQAFYSATGIDPPEVVKFIRKYYPEVKWLRPTMSFWDGIRKYDAPTRWQRWCCSVLKKEQTKKIPLNHHMLGIRAEESFKRKEHGRTEEHSKLGKMNYKPIFNWLEWHVWEFIEHNHVQYPPLYDEGFHRIGCVICPFNAHKNMKAMNRNKERWPHLFRVFEKVLAEWYIEKCRSGKDYHTPEQYIQAWYRGFE